MVPAVAELERSLSRERQREGIDLAKVRGAYRGSTRTLTEEQVRYVRHAAAAGEPKAKIARDVGVARRTVYDVLAGNGAYAVAESSVTRGSGLVGAVEDGLPL